MNLLKYLFFSLPSIHSDLPVSKISDAEHLTQKAYGLLCEWPYGNGAIHRATVSVSQCGGGYSALRNIVRHLACVLLGQAGGALPLLHKALLPAELLWPVKCWAHVGENQRCCYLCPDYTELLPLLISCEAGLATWVRISHPWGSVGMEWAELFPDLPCTHPTCVCTAQWPEDTETRTLLLQEVKAPCPTDSPTPSAPSPFLAVTLSWFLFLNSKVLPCGLPWKCPQAEEHPQYPNRSLTVIPANNPTWDPGPRVKSKEEKSIAYELSFNF